MTSEHDERTGPRRNISGWLGILAVFLAGIVLYFDFTEDDPGISFRYGANLFDGHGLVYNPGDRLEGYSNLGYVILCGLCHKLVMLVAGSREYLVFAIKLVNIACGLLTLWISYLYGMRVLKLGRRTALLGVLLTASNGAFMINAVSPLETSTYTLLLVSLAYHLGLWTEEEQRAAHSGTWLAILAWAVSIWRIDAPVLVAPALCTALVLLGSRRTTWLKARMPVIWLCLYAAYALFRFLYFGELLNNPFHAKIDLLFKSPVTSDYTNFYFTHLGDHSLIFLILFLLAAAADTRRNLMPFVMVMAQWMYVSLIGGDWMTGFRFWAPMTPFISFLLVAVIDRPFAHMSDRAEGLLKTFIISLIAGWWFFSGLGIYQLGGRHPGSWWQKGRDRRPARLNPYLETSRWLNANVSKDALLVVSEAGYIPYLTGLRTIDTFGLCDRELARIEGTRGRLGLKMRWNETYPAVDYILSKNPDVIVISALDSGAERKLGRFVLAVSPEPGINIYVREDSAAWTGRPRPGAEESGQRSGGAQ